MRDALNDLRLCEAALMNAAPNSRSWRALKVRKQTLRLELALQHPDTIAIGG
jgi:hypothetical protein